MQKSYFLIVLLLFFGLSAWAQSRTVSGKVVDAATKEPLPGVSVVVKGTTTGTATDAGGKYSLQVENGAVLIFKFVGMVTQEVSVGESATLDVALDADVRQLSEVVVTGVGEATDKRRVAISVESVSAKDFTLQPTASIDQALQGKVAGALIQSTSGQPGQQQNIILRGINTIGTNGMSGGTQPLVMIDGVQINIDQNTNGSTTNYSSRLADLDLSNIERVEVIQGAAAATLYGAQGANGVIQIFTKRGKAGRTLVDISTTAGTSEILRGNFGWADRHFYNTDAAGNILGPGNVPLAPNPVTGAWPNPLGSVGANTVMDKPFNIPTYNHLDVVFRRAASYNHSINVSGGSEKIQYAANLSKMIQESNIFGSLDRTNARLNLDFEIAKNLKVSTGSNLILSTNTSGGITGADNVESALGNAINAPQYVNYNMRLSDGNYGGRVTGDNSVNPLFAFDNRRYQANTTRAIQTLGLNYKPFKFLEVDYKYGFDRYSYDYRELIKNQLGYLNPGIDPFQGRITKNLDNGTTQNSLLTAFGRFDITDKLKSTTQLAFDWRRQDYNSISAQVTGIPAEADLNLGRGSTPLLNEYNSSFVTYGYLVNQRFEYNEFVGASVGFRTDYSSAFGAGSQAFFFPRGDAFVRLSKLDFWESIKNVVPEFKIRAAYGEAGVQPGPFDRFVTLTPSIIGTQASLINQQEISNPNLKVQKSKEFEIGFDANVAINTTGNWLTTATPSLTYWNRTTDDVIGPIQVALSTGASTRLDNAYAIAAHGLQASLNLQVYESQKFNWNLITNFGTTYSQLTRIANGRDLPLGNNFVLKEGAQIGAFYGVRPLRSIDETNSAGVRYIPENQAANFEVVNGYVVNRTSRAVSFTNEQQLMGNATPKFNMSFINSFSYAQYVTFSFQLDWVYGQDIYNQTRQWLYRDFVHADLTQPVTINGQTAAFTNYYNSLYQVNNPNSHFVENGSFARLRDLSIRADLSKIFQLKQFRNLSVTLSGRNLFTWTKYKGLDPEAASSPPGTAVSRGLDQFAFPNFRSYNVSLNVGF